MWNWAHQQLETEITAVKAAPGQFARLPIMELIFLCVIAFGAATVVGMILGPGGGVGFKAGAGASVGRA